MSLEPRAGRAEAISFRQLRLFMAIGDFKSVRHAAEHCNLSQPAVTQSLSKLEEQIGITLVDRRASGSYLNRHGAIFHARITRFFAQMAAGVRECTADPSVASVQSKVNRLTRSQTRTLLDTIQHGSFKRASDKIGICLSSLQRAARDLESNLGAALFCRTADGLLVSPTGLQFARRVRLALQEVEWGIDEVNAARGNEVLPITIGVMPFGGSVLLASVLDRYLRMHPKVDLRIINDSAPTMLRCLADGAVDLVVGLLPHALDAEIAGMALAPTPFSVVVNRNHPLIRKGKVTLADLVGCDWIVGTAGSSRRACFDAMFGDGPGPRASIATCGLTMMDYLLKNSERVTLMTSYELQHMDGILRSLPFGPIAPVPSIGIMTRQSWMPTALHQDLIDIIRAEVACGPATVRKAG